MSTHDISSQRRRDFLRLATSALVLGSLPLGGVAAESRLKVGIIGSGRVGSGLGASWARAGHEVMFSSLDLEHDRKLAASVGANARAGTPREAAAFGEVLLISVPYGALPQIGKDLGDLLKGKAVIDTCNPFPNRDGEIANWAREKGAGLASAELLPGARIVRAFNAVGAARMADAAQRGGPRSGMPMAGDDKQAIALATRLVRDAGFEPVLVGGLVMGRHLMPGTALAGERTPEEIRKIAASLK
jgi:predicted dinucleotide-binding enzyme